MSVLVLSPHPDDDAIGCGGTILERTSHGDDVHVIYVTSGERGIPNEFPDSATAIREHEAHEAGNILGYKSLDFWHLPDGGGWHVNDTLVQALANTIVGLGAEIIYLPNGHDPHPDHALTHMLGHRAAEYVSTRGPGFRTRIYEVWSPLNEPSRFIDITAHTTLKRAAIRAHKSQLQNGFDDAILGLNHYRGLLHHPDHVMYAEAFA